MAGERQYLHLAGGQDPIWRLWSQLPGPWRGPVIGDDVEGWLRLVRAYLVMGERGKAMSALADARRAVGNDADRLRQLNEGLKSLGLDG